MPRKIQIHPRIDAGKRYTGLNSRQNIWIPPLTGAIMRQIKEIMPLKTSGMPPTGPVMRQKTGSTASAGSGMPRIELRPP
jgi:hypothetical protein